MVDQWTCPVCGDEWDDYHAWLMTSACSLRTPLDPRYGIRPADKKLRDEIMTAMTPHHKQNKSAT
jgi:hypothetical protein